MLCLNGVGMKLECLALSTMMFLAPSSLAVAMGIIPSPSLLPSPHSTL